jgi:hypothetical protein
MRLECYCHCKKCISGDKPPFVLAELQDGVWFRITCPNGHTTSIYLANLKHEILFDLAAMALLDGYTREAASSFASAIERFYEYCIKVFQARHLKDSAAFADTWKLVANQSERQLGAYYFLYLYHFGRCPKAVPQNWVKFRNDTTHKGYIPTRAKVMEYGQYVFDHILELTSEMGKSLKEEMSLVREHELATFKEEAGAGAKAMRGGDTLFTRAYSKEDPLRSLEEGLEFLKRSRWLFP